mgnify:CR=1 FL=1|tara:strand:+ start:1080 stop:1994 length:915 start_codon:yes stop_codon:yes gene_type:complete
MIAFKITYRIFYLFITAYIKKFKINIGSITTNSGTAHSKMSVQESTDYIQTVFHDYKSIAGIERFHGKIAEIGPGDSNGVSLMMIDDGASSVDLVDKYYSNRDEEHEKNVLFNLLPESFEHHQNKVKRYYGKQASSESFFETNKGYSFIVSRAVLEHVDDPLLSLKSMYNALSNGGVLIHKADLRDHGMFSNYNLHELTFLKIPKWLYSSITSNTGRPNRVMADEYVSFIKENFNNYSIYVTGLFGKGQLQPNQYFDIDDLSDQDLEQSNAYIKEIFSDHTDEDYSPKFLKRVISGIFIVIRKE